MPKLTKASFAAAKRKLGIKKVTKKNIGRIAKAARGGVSGRRKTTRKTTMKRKSNPKRGNKRMGRKGKSLYQSMMKLAQAAALIAPPLYAYKRYGNIADPVLIMTGYNMTNGQWEPRRLIEGWAPFVGLTVGAKIVSKVRGLISSI